MGSHYWKTNIDSSDKDYIKYIMPSMDDLYYNKVVSEELIGSTDIVTKDIRMLLRELGKGSVTAFQVLYTEQDVANYYVSKCIKMLRSSRDTIYKEQLPNIKRAIHGQLKQTLSKISKDSYSDKLPKLYADVYKWNTLLDMIIDGYNPFIEWFSGNYYNECLRIRNGEESFDIEGLSAKMDSLVFEDRPSSTPMLDLHNNIVKSIVFDNLNRDNIRDIRRLPTYKSKYTGFNDYIPGHGGCAMTYVLSDETANALRVYSSEDLNRVTKFYDWELGKNSVYRGDGIYVVCWECLDDYCQGDSADIFIGTAEEVEDFIKDSFKDTGVDTSLLGKLPSIISKDITIHTYKYTPIS